MATIEYLTVEHLSTKDLTRIFSKISIDPATAWNGIPCWTWHGCRTKRGYGRTHWINTNYITHRLIYAWAVGPIPKGQSHGELDHLCRRPSCCNPLHLEFIPTRINVLRSNAPAAVNARKTHCIQGHELSADNLTPWSVVKGFRNCQKCNEIRNLARRKPPQTHCKYGHPLSGDNLYRSNQGNRICRECARRWSRERARAQRLLNPLKFKERLRQWRLNNPDRYKETTRRGNAKRATAGLRK